MAPWRPASRYPRGRADPLDNVVTEGLVTVNPAAPMHQRRIPTDRGPTAEVPELPWALLALSSLAPFLPPHLVRSLSAGGSPSRLPSVERFSAALLLSDISGFTALTEKLQARGREGAEEIARVVSAAFRPAIRAIERSGGSILSFGGDSLLALFPGRAAASRAMAAARGIDSAFEGRRLATRAGAAELGISQVLHYGAVLGQHLGTQSRRHYLVSGNAVTRLARLGAQATGKPLTISPAAHRQLQRERRHTAVRPSAVARHASVLLPYVEPRLAACLPGFEGQYRRAAILFIETKDAATAKLDALFAVLLEALDRYRGMLLKTDLSSSGTKWLCVFGIPRAHEDDPDRAVRAGLDVLATAPRGLDVRGACHAGVVANLLIGSASRRSFDVMGDVVNTTARALGCTAWGELVVPSETRSLLPGASTEPRGRHAVKGKARPLEVHAVVRSGGVRELHVMAPMVGRDEELRRIVHALERAARGEGSRIGIEGEAGLGKSRLKYEAARVARELGFEVHEGRAVSFGGVSYGVVAGLLRHALGVPEGAGHGRILEAVAEAAGRLGLGPVDRHHLAEILGARYEASPIGGLRPADVRLNNNVALRAACEALARETPRLLVLEDMHWADGASVEGAAWLAEGAPASRMVVLELARPGHPRPAGSSEIVLSELDETALDVLLRTYLGTVSSEVAALVRGKSGGNPFYLEELTRHLQETGVLELGEEGCRLLREPRLEELPGSVESLIAARLDRLPAPARRLAQAASVMGRRFRTELLARLPRLQDVPGALEELRRRELVVHSERGAVMEFAFKHALTRDVAYASILKGRRRKLHAAVALALEEAGDVEQGLAATLGHHWEEAGIPARARRHYAAGAAEAGNRSRLDERERLLSAYIRVAPRRDAERLAIELQRASALAALGRTEEAYRETVSVRDVARARRWRPLEVQACTSLAAIAARMHSLEEALAHCRRAADLTRGSRDAFLKFETARHRGDALAHMGRSREALRATESALRWAHRTGDPATIGIASGSVGNCLLLQSRFDDAHRRYTEALALFERDGNAAHAAVTHLNLANVCDDLGRTEEALVHYERALVSLRALGQRSMEGTTLMNYGKFLHNQGDFMHARAVLEEALALLRTVGHRSQEAVARTYLGDVLVRLDEKDAALDCYERSADVLAQMGSPLFEAASRFGAGTLRLAAADLGRARRDFERTVKVSRSAGREQTALQASIILLRIDRLEGALLPEPELQALAAALPADATPLLRLALTCEQGHQAIVRGASAAPHLLAAETIARPSMGTSSLDMESHIARLRRAVAAADAGRPTPAGEAVEDHPILHPLRTWATPGVETG